MTLPPGELEITRIIARKLPNPGAIVYSRKVVLVRDYQIGRKMTAIPLMALRLPTASAMSEFEGKAGKHVLVLSSSQFDPNPDISAQTKLVPLNERKERTDSPPNASKAISNQSSSDNPVARSKGALQSWTRKGMISRAARLAYPIPTAAR